jgi:hypothetical protein
MLIYLVIPPHTTNNKNIKEDDREKKMKNKSK